MIRSFKDRLTSDLFNGVRSAKASKIPADIRNIALRKLDQVNAADRITDLRIPPGNRLEKLKGDLKEYYSIRVNDQYRIIFQWQHDGAYNVELLDYH